MPALCVECDAELNLGPRARIGQRIICPSCGVQLEVISTRPLEVDVAIDDGEEWDDLDGYSLDDEDDLEDVGRINGLRSAEDDLDEFEDDLEDEWDGFDVEGEEELDDWEEDELDEADGSSRP